MFDTLRAASCAALPLVMMTRTRTIAKTSERVAARRISTHLESVLTEVMSCILLAICVGDECEHFCAIPMHNDGK